MDHDELIAFSFETIIQADPAAAAAFDTAWRRLTLDLIDRPADTRARKVTIVLEAKPVMEVIGNVQSCEGANVTATVKSSLPDIVTPGANFGVTVTGQMIFNPSNPTNHQQRTLPLETDEE